MSKHTPGPWTYSRFDEFGVTRFYVAQQDGAPYTINFSDAATLIAETVSVERLAIQEANARLIAASPEMLEALELFASSRYQVSTDIDPNGNRWSDAYLEQAIELTLSVIAKAKGDV